MAITQLINGLFFFVGKSWYDSAVVHNGDKLNGEILMGLGVIIAISTIVYASVSCSLCTVVRTHTISRWYMSPGK